MTQETPQPPATFQRCANCGAELRPNDRFCGECGLPVYVSPGQEAKPVGAPQETSPAPPPTTATVPATPPPPVPPKPRDGTWAVVVGVVLILIGLASCALGAIAIALAPEIWLDDPNFISTFQAGSGLCCILPAVLLAIAGGVVWYVWGRKKA